MFLRSTLLILLFAGGIVSQNELPDFVTKVLQSNDIKSALQSVAKNISEVSSPVQREELLKNVTEYLKTLLSKKESAKNGIFGISIGSLPFLHVVGGNETVPETTTSPETTVITTTHEKEVKTTTEAPTTTTTTLPVTTTVTTTEPVHTTLATTTVANDTEVISLIKSLTALTNAQLQSNITHNTTEAPITTTEVATTAENITVEHHNETTTTSESIVNETTTTHSALIELINKTEVVDNITNYLLTHVFANTTEEPQTTAYNATINITEAVFPTLSSNVTEHNITTEGHLVVITEATVNETTTNATEIILIPELVNTTEIVANTTTLFENTTVTVLIATATNETTTTGNITIIRELHNETNRVGFELRVIKGKNWEEGLANPDSPEFNHFRQELEPGILKIMKDSLPKDQFAGGKVTKFMSGSVIVTGELYTNSVVNKDEVVTKVKEEIRANHDKIHDYEVDPESFRLFDWMSTIILIHNQTVPIDNITDSVQNATVIAVELTHLTTEPTQNVTNATEEVLLTRTHVLESVENATTSQANLSITILPAATSEKSVVVETTDDSKTNRVGFVMRVIDGKTWDESLADPNSWEFTNFQQYIEPGIQKLMKDVIPKDQYLGAKVTKFTAGSVIVFGELSTNTAVNLEETLPKIKEKIRANNSKIHDFVVDPESFQFIDPKSSAAVFPSSGTGATIPGWGVGLLVAAIIIVCLLALISIVMYEHIHGRCTFLSHWPCMKKRMMNGKTGIPRDDVPNGLTYQKDAELELEDKQKRLDSHFVDVDLNSNSTAPHNDASGHRGTNKLKQQHNSDHPEYLYMHYAITPEPQEFKSPITDKDGEIVQKNSD